jgi:hypothetical protein
MIEKEQERKRERKREPNEPQKIVLNQAELLDLTRDTAYSDGYRDGVQDTLARLKRRQLETLVAKQKQVQSSQEKKKPEDTDVTDVASMDAG